MSRPGKPTPERTAQGVGENSATPSSAGVSPESDSPQGFGTDGATTGKPAEESAVPPEGEPLDAVVLPSTDEMVAQAKLEAADWQDKFMRLHAEWDTYRRRTTEQREEERRRATEKLVSSLLPVIDDFERTITYATKNGEQGLMEGVCAVRTKFIDVLTKDGVEIINPEGNAFDALEAQAVATVEDIQVPDETVAEVYQKGYRMGSKVLRPAMVVVTTGGPKRPKPAEEA